MFRAHVLIIRRCDDTRGFVMQFWPSDDKHMCSKHVEAWNKLIVKQKFCASSWLITGITGIYVRAKCFDLVGHPQTLHEKHLGSHNAEKLNNSCICFSWRAWGWPTRSKHVALTYIPLYIKQVLCYWLTYNIYLYVVTLRDGKLKKYIYTWPIMKQNVYVHVTDFKILLPFLSKLLCQYGVTSAFMFRAISCHTDRKNSHIPDEEQRLMLEKQN